MKRHTVHTKHPRYKVPNYPRGSDANSPSPHSSKAPPTVHEGREAYRLRLVEHEKMRKASGLGGVKYKRKHVKKAHLDRSDQARATDDALQATVTDDYNEWMANPDKYDVYGVDYFPVVTKAGDEEFNYKAMEYSMKQYYGVADAPPVKPVFHTSEAEYDKVFGKEASSSEAYAFYRYWDDPPTIHFSPTATRLIAKGKIEDIHDFGAMESIAHEYEHHIGVFYGSTSFDEGSTELLANRYAWMALSMDAKTRNKLRGVNAFAYPDHVKMVGNTALIIHDFDETDAVDWLKKLRRSDQATQKEMVRDAEKKLAKAGLMREGATEDTKRLARLERDEGAMLRRRGEYRSEARARREPLGFVPNGIIDVTTLMVNEKRFEEELAKRSGFKQNQYRDDAFAYANVMEISNRNEDDLRRIEPEIRNSKARAGFSPFALDKDAPLQDYLIYKDASSKYIDRATHYTPDWWVDV